jgi:hypothetical protein
MPESIIERDSLFRYLVKFSIVENYYKRALYSRIRDGAENHDLIAPLIVRDLSTIRTHVRQNLEFRKLGDIDLKHTLIAEAKKDGAYVLDGRTLSNKVYLQNVVQKVLRDKGVKTIENMQKHFLPEDFLHDVKKHNDLIGTRTQNAISAGLLGGKSYVVKQTAYGHSGLGKVCVFDKTGIAAEFFLKKDAESRLPSAHYYHPLRKIVGVLHEYPTKDKTNRVTATITPSDLNIQVSKYLNLSDKIATNVSSLFKLMPLGI